MESGTEWMEVRKPKPTARKVWVKSVDGGKPRYYCTVCGVTCGSEADVQAHSKGRRHQQALNLSQECDILQSATADAIRTPTSSLPMNSAAAAVHDAQHALQGQIIRCNICNIPASSFANLQQHWKGKKHISAVQAQKQAGHPAPSSATARTLLVPRPVLEQPSAPSLPRSSQEEATSKFHCKLCNVRCPSGISLQQHYNGAKHKQRAALAKWSHSAGSQIQPNRETARSDHSGSEMQVHASEAPRVQYQEVRPPAWAARPALAESSPVFPPLRVQSLDHGERALPSATLSTDETNGHVPYAPIREVDLIACPLSKEAMTDPVYASDGFTYQRAAILSWFKRTDCSPITGAVLSDKSLIGNRLVKEIVDVLLGMMNVDCKTFMDRGVPVLQAASLD